jgi:hypothetical protein
MIFQRRVPRNYTSLLIWVPLNSSRKNNFWVTYLSKEVTTYIAHLFQSLKLNEIKDDI